MTLRTLLGDLELDTPAAGFGMNANQLEEDTTSPLEAFQAQNRQKLVCREIAFLEKRFLPRPSLYGRATLKEEHSTVHV